MVRVVGFKCSFTFLPTDQIFILAENIRLAHMRPLWKEGIMADNKAAKNVVVPAWH